MIKKFSKICTTSDPKRIYGPVVKKVIAVPKILAGVGKNRKLTKKPKLTV